MRRREQITRKNSSESFSHSFHNFFRKIVRCNGNRIDHWVMFDMSHRLDMEFSNYKRLIQQKSSFNNIYKEKCLLLNFFPYLSTPIEKPGDVLCLLLGVVGIREANTSVLGFFVVGVVFFFDERRKRFTRSCLLPSLSMCSAFSVKITKVIAKR